MQMLRLKAAMSTTQFDATAKWQNLPDKEGRAPP